MNMKTRFFRILALALVLALLPAAALAAGDRLVARRGLDGFDGQVDCLCAVEDVIWMYGDEAVYACDAASGDLTEYPFAAEWLTARQGVYDPEKGATLYRNVSAWFSWNGAVYALVSTADGAGVIDAGLCRLTIDEQGEADFQRAGGVDWQPLLDDEYLQIDSCHVVNDVLCAVCWQGDQRLCFIPLDDRPATVTDIFCEQLCPWDDGLLAARMEWSDRPEYTFYRVDVPSGRAVELRRYEPEEGEVEAIAQEPGDGRLLCVMNGYLTALDLTRGEAERVAPLPVSVDQHGGAGAVMLPCGAFAAGSYEGVAIRQVTSRPEGEAIELVVGQDFTADALDEAALTFGQDHPGVTVAMVEANRIVERLLSHMDDVDIFVLNSEYGDEAALADILTRGYALELDSDILTDYVSSLYPALKDAFMKDGRVVAVPLGAQAMGLSVNTAALEALGLSMDDVPANWPDFLAFIDGLKGNGKAPVLSAWTDLINARLPLLQRLLKDYQLELRAGRRTSWDSPELRAALQAFAAVDFEGLLEDAQAFQGVWEENGLVNGYDSVGVSGIVFSNPHEGTPLRLSLSPDTPAVLPVQCTVAIVNPASRHPAEAVALLEAAVDHIPHAERAMLSPDFGQPERDEAAYQRAVGDVARQIESLRARAEAGDDEAAAQLEQTLDFQTRMADYYWIISPDSLAWYRAHDEHVALSLSGELEEIDVFDILFTAAKEGFDPDALIATIEKKAQMRRLEK